MQHRTRRRGTRWYPPARPRRPSIGNLAVRAAVVSSTFRWSLPSCECRSVCSSPRCMCAVRTTSATQRDPFHALGMNILRPTRVVRDQGIEILPARGECLTTRACRCQRLTRSKTASTYRIAKLYRVRVRVGVRFLLSAVTWALVLVGSTCLAQCMSVYTRRERSRTHAPFPALSSVNHLCDLLPTVPFLLRDRVPRVRRPPR